jgi:hypothetical protein
VEIRRASVLAAEEDLQREQHLGPIALQFQLNQAVHQVGSLRETMRASKATRAVERAGSAARGGWRWESTVRRVH